MCYHYHQQSSELSFNLWNWNSTPIKKLTSHSLFLSSSLKPPLYFLPLSVWLVYVTYIVESDSIYLLVTGFFSLSIMSLNYIHVVICQHFQTCQAWPHLRTFVHAMLLRFLSSDSIYYWIALANIWVLSVTFSERPLAYSHSTHYLVSLSSENFLF